MEKLFKSRKDTMIGIVTFIVPTATLILSFKDANWLAGMISIMLFSVMLYIWLSAVYFVSPTHLRIRFFFSNISIPIENIKSIKRKTSYLAGSGLSKKRLEINYNTYDSISISPIEEEIFLRELLNSNPAISVR